MFIDLSRTLILNRLQQLISDFGVKKGPFSEVLTINHDLRLKSDDSDHFMTAIHKHYCTRFDGYDGRRYFQGNIEARFGMPGINPKTKPLTVGHLVDVIQRGAWFDPPPA